ncbi:MAG: ABC transporter ATP-binding protein [Candidatus Methylomirabilia bacterium]
MIQSRTMVRVRSNKGRTEPAEPPRQDGGCEAPTPARAEIAASFRWTLGTLWDGHRALTLAAAAMVLVRGLLPAALALTARGLINAAAHVLHHPEAGRRALVVWLALGFLAALAEALSVHVNTLLVTTLTEQVNTRLTVAVLREAQRRPLAFFETPGLRETVERARVAATGRVASFVTATQSAATQILQTLSLIGVLAVVDPLVVLAVGPVAVPFLAFQWRIARRRHGVVTQRTWRSRLAAYFSALLTAPQSIPEIRILGIGPALADRFERTARKFQEQDRPLMFRNLAGVAGFSLLTVLTFYAVLVRVVMRTARGAATLGDLAIFAAAAVRLRVAIEGAVLRSTEALEQVLYITDLQDFLASREREEDRPAPDPGALGGGIEFRDVAFSYPGSPTPALAGCSLTIREGETLALVGRNGAGKTTLVKLLARLYDPDEGAVLIGGRDLRSVPRARVLASLSVVMQHFGRYEVTAGENIAFGDWERLRNRPELVRDIALRTGVADLIDALPQGFETTVGRAFGVRDLSGGEWQRVALARGFARQAPILVLDEPTAALDAHSELELYRKFAGLARGRTTILISHRFSTIGMADRIAVLDSGRVVEVGTHDELIARGGEYAELYRLHTRWMREGTSPE